MTQPPSTIDVSGLPEPVVQDIARLVTTLRDNLRAGKPEVRSVPLPRWTGTVLGAMHRREFYDDDR